MTPPPSPEAEATHQRELHRFGAFALIFAALLLVPYATPALASLRPWLPGEPLPLLGIWQRQVTERDDGTLESLDPDPELFSEVASAGTREDAPPTAEEAVLPLLLEPLWPPASIELPRHPPGRRVPLEVPMGALDAYFSALAAVADGEPGRIGRALVWGDSIIAADQVIGDIRGRMQARFGDGGPGFLPVQIDPYWSVRGDLARSSTGTWLNQTIVSGDSPDYRYGLAGVASTATTAATASLGVLSKTATTIHRVQLFFLRQPGGGGMAASIRGAGIRTGTDAERRGDVVTELFSEEGGTRLSVSTDGTGPVTFYGAALEAQGPGVTWETFGIAGAHISAMNRQGRAHLRQQVASRSPDLLVYWTGGNEIAYPSVQKGDGSTYQRIYRRVIQKLREGAPAASCMLIGPLDQATRLRGHLQSKDGIQRLIDLQRAVAREEGCVYWDAHAAMGGEGAFLRWMRHDPPLALPDLMHISREGGAILGDLLADALLASYDRWRQEHPTAGWLPPESTP